MKTNNESTVPAVVETTEINKLDTAAPVMMESLTNAYNQFFCSIKDDGSRAAKIRTYNAINSAQEKLDDHKKEILSIKDVAAHPIQLVDENTGEVVVAMRVILIAEDNTTYECVSAGVVSSLQKIFAIIGMPTWEEPVKMMPVEQKTRKGFKVLTLELVL